MNTAVKALHHTESLRHTSFHFVSPKLGIGTLFLVILILLSGFAVIYLADINRRMAISVEEATNTQNQLHLEWGKLLLEQSTWSTQARIQNIAVQKLNMQTPNNNQTTIVKIEA